MEAGRRLASAPPAHPAVHRRKLYLVRKSSFHGRGMYQAAVARRVLYRLYTARPTEINFSSCMLLQP